MEELNNIIQLQVQRKFINLNKEVLIKLEELHTYIKSLEKILYEAGFDNFKESQYDYKKDRGAFLGKTNDAIREIESQLEMFDVQFKRK